MPFGKPFGTLGGHIQSGLVAQFGCHIKVICYLVRNSFDSGICVHSESLVQCFGRYIALVRHGSGWFDLSSLSGAFAGILDVRRRLGELIVSDRGVRSLPLHWVCLLINL